jgi:hypothetical protein
MESLKHQSYDIIQTLKRIFIIKQKSGLVVPLITLLYIDILHACLIITLIILAMCIDHELIVRSLILSVYTFCPLAAIDLIRHINLTVHDQSHIMESGKDVDDIWIKRTTSDIGLFWLITPFFSAIFIAGSFVDFVLYINHEVEHSTPKGNCEAGCAVSAFGAVVTGLLFVSCVVYIICMIRIFRKLSALKEQ